MPERPSGNASNDDATSFEEPEAKRTESKLKAELLRQELKLQDEHLNRVEKYSSRPIYEWLKHQITLSSASILLILACSEKLFRDDLITFQKLVLTIFITASMLGFLVTIIRSWFGMLATFSPVHFEAKPALDSVKFSGLCFNAGFCALVFAIVSYFNFAIAELSEARSAVLLSFSFAIVIVVLYILVVALLLANYLKRSE